MREKDAMANAGYEYDFAAHRLTFSDALRSDFGISDAEASNPACIFERIAFEDYPAIAEACGEIYCSQADELSLCLKLTDRQDCHVRRIQVMARVQYDLLGRPLRLWGCVEDAAMKA